MRTFIAVFALLLGTQAFANDELGPGDKGYRHEEMHPFYKLLFGQGRCNCHTGECRPTIYRTDNRSPSGIQVILNGEWIDVPQESIQMKQSVPPELWPDPAHICAFMRNGELVVECAIINSGV